MVHKDLDNKVPSYLGEINLYTGANYSVQIVQNKLKNKNNMKVEHYYEEKNQFYSKGIIWYFWNIFYHTFRVNSQKFQNYSYEPKFAIFVGKSQKKWKLGWIPGF